MEKTREQIMGEITALKMLLRDTDYEVTKYAEGLTDCTTQKQIEAYRAAFMVKYGDMIENRKTWRAKINELEETLDALEDEDAAPADDESDAEDTERIDYPEYVVGDTEAVEDAAEGENQEQAEE